MYIQIMQTEILKGLLRVERTSENVVRVPSKWPHQWSDMHFLRK